MEYLAHSAKDGFPSQSYVEHVTEVKNIAVANAKAAATYAKLDGEALIRYAEESGEYHDLGKLTMSNQEALHNSSLHAPLPVNHVDAGAALLKKRSHPIPALMVYAHHIGLPNLAEEFNKKENCYRDERKETRALVDSELEQLLRIHSTIINGSKTTDAAPVIRGDRSIFDRMLLSCLADADHTNTASHYGKYPKDLQAPSLRAAERLDSLNKYVSAFDTGDNRNRLRSEMYTHCRDVTVDESIAACDSPVGSGKTTALMAHLLSQANARKARRIFVVLPFTNVIEQSVEVYRKALVLPGESPDDVVAELHHRADFDSEDLRAFNAQWRAPIVVTTAVAFFETIASNRPASLRRLHELPGSMIFVDEAHAALPLKLLPLAWRWMQILADQWSCYWVLASGSLVRFWEIEEISEQERFVPNIICEELRHRLSAYENRRIRYPLIKTALSRNDLIQQIKNAPGPRLVIMNTLQNASVIARDLMASYKESSSSQGSKVLHLSTALSSLDRRNTIEAIKNRLSDPSDTDWTLVATSCVEAGVDFSFRTGFREAASLLSLLQASGRINRNGKIPDAAIYSFTLQDDPMLKKNPGIQDAIKALLSFFDMSRPISPDLSTEAILYEIDMGTDRGGPEANLIRWEKANSYALVKEHFHVIDSETVLVAVDEEMKDKICYGHCDWKEIQKKCVAIRKTILKELPPLPILAEGVYDWNLGYDPVFGIMKGMSHYLDMKYGFLQG